MSEAITVRLGNPLPLRVVIADGVTGLFIEAIVRDSAGASVGGSPFALSDTAGDADYRSVAHTPTAPGLFTAAYRISAVSLGGAESPLYGRDGDRFRVEDELGLLGRNQVFQVLTRQSASPFKPLTTRIRTYRTDANATLDDGATGLLSVHTMVSTYDLANTGPNLIKHTMIEP